MGELKNKNTVGNANVGRSKLATKDKPSKEQKLEQGLEESMAGSDPISVTQPTRAGASE